MSQPDWEIAAEIFADALERPRDERSALVVERCSGRPEILAAVERLLAAHESAHPAFLLEHNLVRASPAGRSTVEPLERVGPYRLVREIGSGGMGQVFLAERSDGQFAQRVAVKLLKRGMDSDAILARFLRERQILAGLEHPHVARLIDGGIAEDGRPYFVMEHVDGWPITQYCDDRRLTVDERLSLFSLVCSAVEYAHRNLVVHRDLKPSNILVTAEGQPKLLDFGIARVIAAGEPDVEDDPLTIGAPMLTPEYAAPEQLRGEVVTTATDVYGAGAVLYELLAGFRPFTRQESAARMHALNNTEPLSPARVLARAQPDDVRDIAARRRTDPMRLRRRLAGDLDSIVATALCAEPERRYASAEAFREDIRRHRQHLPVKAMAATTSYRISRFLRRHRVSASVAAVIAALVLTFAVTASVQANRIRRQAAALENERDRAEREAEAARSVSDFLIGVFEVSDPTLEGRGDSIRATELLDRGARQIDADLSGQPALQARMLSVMGRAYDNLLRSDQAEPLVERALALERQIHGNDSEVVVDALQQLALVRSRRGDSAGAEAALLEALAIQERRGAGPGTHDPRTWSLLVDLAGAAHGVGDHRRGSQLTQDAVAMYDRMPPDGFGGSRASLIRLAQLLSFSSGEMERADRLYARLVELQGAATGPRSAAIADVYADWAEARERRRELEAADSLMSLALAIREESDSMGVGTAHLLNRLAAFAFTQGAFERSDSLYRRAIEIFRATRGDDHRTVAIARTQLAETLSRRGHFAEAIGLHERALSTYEALGESAAALVPPARWRLGVVLEGAGRSSEAIAQYEIALRAFTARFPADYLLTANIRRDYGLALVEVGRFAEAEAALLPAIEVLGKRWGDTDFRVDLARISLGRALTGQRRHGEARAVLDAAVMRLQERRGAQDSITVRARAALADAVRRR